MQLEISISPSGIQLIELKSPSSLFTAFTRHRTLTKTFKTLLRISTVEQHQSFVKMKEEEVEKLRGVVRDCVSKHLYSSAIFFADKVAAFTNDPADIYMQAQALFLGSHFRRAFHLLLASKIVFRDLRFRYLAAKCLVRVSSIYVTLISATVLRNAAIGCKNAFFSLLPKM